MANVVIRDLDEGLLGQVKTLTGEATNSKSLIAAARMAIESKKTMANQRELIDKLNNELNHRNQVLKKLLPLMIQAAEIAGQEELNF